MTQDALDRATHWIERDTVIIKSLEAVIERLRAALIRIRDEAHTTHEDQYIWMDNRTTLGAFIDMTLNAPECPGQQQSDT